MDFLIYDKIGILIIFIDNYYSLLASTITNGTTNQLRLGNIENF